MKYLKKFNESSVGVEIDDNNNIVHTVDTLKEILQELMDEGIFSAEIETLNNSIRFAIDKPTNDVECIPFRWNEISNCIKRCDDYIISEGCQMNKIIVYFRDRNESTGTWNSIKEMEESKSISKAINCMVFYYSEIEF